MTIHAVGLVHIINKWLATDSFDNLTIRRKYRVLAHSHLEGFVYCLNLWNRVFKYFPDSRYLRRLWCVESYCWSPQSRCFSKLVPSLCADALTLCDTQSTASALSRFILNVLAHFPVLLSLSSGALFYMCLTWASLYSTVSCALAAAFAFVEPCRD